jgi:glyoxylase-like metal-dependent hydrolase (beta-lactamase superfamily II)
MELLPLQVGDLMGSPDVKDLLLDAGPGTDAAHAVWEDLSAIKLAFGWSGRATSLVLLEPDCPEGFPAWVDPSWVTPDPSTHGPASVDAALTALTDAGVALDAIRTVLVTHDHPDHVDTRVLRHLPNAVVHAPDSPILPDAVPFDADRLGHHVTAIDTPGHWGPHTSYRVDLPQQDLSVCLAGDLIMSHAHLLAMDHPLAFADHDAARGSLRRVIEALDASGRRYQAIWPGHDRPIFLTERIRGLMQGIT